ncbi:SH3 domain-containing protein [Chlorogloea sp. CCALA 695]|uniref:SH3 domain-containing protein n=1 Tax=Chlorogloea sp. CCALA 695 TaxID=2107693 RepID=UPI000D06DB76|nr:SH3 domain-containing protein [Chlorogloea sp. CCALA 695]PSB34527.1 peptide-binding protein [Chlorogloea sp. CCALA 695]
MSWTSGLVKLVLGFVIAITLLISGSVALALIFINRASSPPPKPIFANDSSAVKKTANITKPKTSIATKNAPKSKPSPSLASGSYPARVTWNQGLSLRSEPSLDAERIGSLDYNQKIVVLQQSKDEKWQQIRLDDSELQGWVKAGNTERE